MTGPEISVERGTVVRHAVIYKCGFCKFESTSPELAQAHLSKENKGRRHDSQWRHEIVEVRPARGDSPIVIEYWDSVHFKNLPKPPGLARRRCVGWIVEETSDCVKILSDMPVEKLPGEIAPPGSAGYTISRVDIIRLQRVGCA